VACYKFWKNIFWSSNFKNNANYTILVPQYFSNLILIQKFIFVIFYSLIDIYVKWLRLMIAVHVRCFFIVKIREKTDLSSNWFLILGWFWFLGRFLGFFKAMYKFIMVSKVFYRCFESKKNWLRNRFLRSKKLKPWFSGYCGGQNLSKLDDASCDFF
jgi:hypothetical protein